MATIEKRQNADGTIGYRVKVRLKGFEPQSETFERLTDARRWAEKTETAMREGRHFPERKTKDRTLAELVDRYIRDVCPEKKGGEKTARQLGWWREAHGFRTLASLTPEVLAEARDKLAAKVLPSGKRVTGATVNRYMAALSHALTLASREWGWTRENPMRRVTKKKESRGRVRILSDAERDKLLAACQQSGCASLLPAVVLAFSTGMRQGEIVGLRWPDVDLARGHLVLHDTKNGERRGVVIVRPALEVLRELAKVRSLDDDRVLPETGSLRWAFLRAVRKAKIVDLRFHDLRHTAASYLAMNGASPSEIADVLGHKTLAMVKRYAHLHDAHKAKVMNSMSDNYLAGVEVGPLVRQAKRSEPSATVVPLRKRRATGLNPCDGTPGATDTDVQRGSVATPPPPVGALTSAAVEPSRPARIGRRPARKAPPPDGVQHPSIGHQRP